MRATPSSRRRPRRRVATARRRRRRDRGEARRPACEPAVEPHSDLFETRVKCEYVGRIGKRRVAEATAGAGGCAAGGTKKDRARSNLPRWRARPVAVPRARPAVARRRRRRRARAWRRASERWTGGGLAEGIERAARSGQRPGALATGAVAVEPSDARTSRTRAHGWSSVIGPSADAGAEAAVGEHVGEEKLPLEADGEHAVSRFHLSGLRGTAGASTPPCRCTTTRRAPRSRAGSAAAGAPAGAAGFGGFGALGGFGAFGGFAARRRRRRARRRRSRPRCRMERAPPRRRPPRLLRRLRRLPRCLFRRAVLLLELLDEGDRREVRARLPRVPLRPVPLPPDETAARRRRAAACSFRSTRSTSVRRGAPADSTHAGQNHAPSGTTSSGGCMQWVWYPLSQPSHMSIASSSSTPWQISQRSGSGGPAASAAARLTPACSSAACASTQLSCSVRRVSRFDVSAPRRAFSRSSSSAPSVSLPPAPPPPSPIPRGSSSQPPPACCRCCRARAAACRPKSGCCSAPSPPRAPPPR